VGAPDPGDRAPGVVPYDPRWPVDFETVRARVQPAVSGVAVAVEHVGSTAVRGLAAKPVIDVDVVVAAEADVPRAVAALASIGARHRGDLGVPGREAFAPLPGLPDHHLYVVVQGSPAHRDHVDLRDHLRTHPHDAERYAAEKRRLAPLLATDRDAYVDGKGWLVRELLAAARTPAPPRAGADAVVDAHHGDPRLAELYDPLDPDRSDLDLYLRLVEEFGAGTVLDIGCGTGTFACLLADGGVEVVGVDPAAASLAVARGKPGADRVRWLLGAASSVPALGVDLATMTGNVAQVFRTDDEWTAALRAVRTAIRPGGRFVFESRDPDQRAWREWDREHTTARAVVPHVGEVESWVEVTDVRDELVSFRQVFVLGHDGTVLTSASTLRFRSRAELADSVAAAGLVVDDVRDAPDRPGRELVFLTRRLD
jgi:GrpB-like predicted nucleotidyltransferase (UPF0157 family)/SAM-dependent methyltransferase